HANFGYAGKNGDVTDSKANQFTLGYNYNLSKRTKVYAFYTRLNDGDAGLYGGDFRSFALGVRHNF
ncbi:porin, partial [Escherichia coli]|nr:porin [Escherichia coli]